MYDVFISYRRDGGYEMARLIYEHLKFANLNTFFDVEELGSGPFNTKLYDIIENSLNFLLILSPSSLDRCQNEDDWVRLEIECAIKNNKNIIPIMMKNFEWPTTLPKSIEIISKYNGLEMSREYFDASIKKIINLLNNVKNSNYKQEIPSEKFQNEKRENLYFDSSNTNEIKRLQVQQNLLQTFDHETFNRLTNSYNNITALDVGSNSGDMIMNRIGGKENVNIIIGLEYDSETVKKANLKYNKDNAFFYQINVEKDELEDRLKEIMNNHNIEYFNIINLSMILLHLKNPFKLLKTLRKFLSPDGTIVIRDIDDGLNFAFPDENGDFKKAIDICKQNETAGFREIGRQIYTLLKRAGYNAINLEKCGLSTIRMDFDEREALFNTYFSFIMDDCKLMFEKYPNNKNCVDNYLWYKDIYDDLEERFLDETFIFSLGFMLFTARKK